MIAADLIETTVGTVKYITANIDCFAAMLVDRGNRQAPIIGLINASDAGRQADRYGRVTQFIENCDD